MFDAVEIVRALHLLVMEIIADSLFVNDADMVLRLASALTNYLVFP